MHELTQLNSIYHINHLHLANQFFFVALLLILRCCWPLSDGLFPFPCVIKCLNECCSLSCVIILISESIWFLQGVLPLAGDPSFDQSLGDQLLCHEITHLIRICQPDMHHCFCVTFCFLITFSTRWDDISRSMVNQLELCELMLNVVECCNSLRVVSLVVSTLYNRLYITLFVVMNIKLFEHFL